MVFFGCLKKECENIGEMNSSKKRRHKNTGRLKKIKNLEQKNKGGRNTHMRAHTHAHAHNNRLLFIYYSLFPNIYFTQH
jgi:hypothetical protein